MELALVTTLAHVLMAMKESYVIDQVIQIRCSQKCMIFVSSTVYKQCDENLCMNGATCRIVASDYICFCAYGFSGPFCNTSKNIIINCVSIKVIFIFYS